MTHLDDFYQDWDLRDAFEEKVRECNALNAEISRLLQKLIDGEQRMRELEGDRERLDWLDRNLGGAGLSICFDGERLLYRFGPPPMENHLREAIDAARQSEGE